MENVESLGQGSAGLTESQTFLKEPISPETQAALDVPASGADQRKGRERMAFPGERAARDTAALSGTGADLGNWDVDTVPKGSGGKAG